MGNINIVIIAKNQNQILSSSDLAHWTALEAGGILQPWCHTQWTIGRNIGRAIWKKECKKQSLDCTTANVKPQSNASMSFYLNLFLSKHYTYWLIMFQPPPVDRVECLCFCCSIYKPCILVIYSFALGFSKQIYKSLLLVIYSIEKKTCQRVNHKLFWYRINSMEFQLQLVDSHFAFRYWNRGGSVKRTVHMQGQSSQFLRLSLCPVPKLCPVSFSSS